MLELSSKLSAIDVVPDLRAVVANVMDIADVTAGLQDGNTARFRGQLLIDSADAYQQLMAGFQQFAPQQTGKNAPCRQREHRFVREGKGLAKQVLGKERPREYG